MQKQKKYGIVCTINSKEFFSGFFARIFRDVENKRAMSRISFVSFCIEYYAEHIGKPSNEVYRLFKKEKVLDLLESDYDDLHGMGMEYLMHFIDEYLGVAK